MFLISNQIMYIFIIVILLLFFAFMFYRMFYNSAKRIREEFVGKRFDDNHTLKYFTHHDYPNMEQKQFDFSSNSYKLKGYIYKDVTKEIKGKVIFIAGRGVGHIQYTNDIHFYCEQGYEVYTFDGQGCLNSEGDGVHFFTNYVKNTESFFAYLSTLNNDKYIVVAHSMGAFCANLMLKFHPEMIKCLVSMSSFNSIKQIYQDIIHHALNGKLGKIVAYFMYIQDRNNFKQYDLDSIEVIKQSSIPVLLVSGDKDIMVDPNYSYFKYKKELQNQDNVYFLTSINREHNPYLSIEGTEYNKKTRDMYHELSKRFNHSIPEEELQNYYLSLDYKLMVQLDYKVMDVILSFINSDKIEKITEIN